MSLRGLAAIALGSLLAGCGPKPEEPFDCSQPGAVCTVVGDGNHGWGEGDGRPGPKTSLYFPTAVRFDRDGNPLIDDFNNLRIRTIDRRGRVVTLAGSGWHAFAFDGIEATESPLENPIDVWPTPDGGFVVAELHAARVLHVDATGWLTVLAGTGDVGYTGDGGPAREAEMSELNGIALDDEGTIYIADTDNHCIRAIDPATGIIRAVAGTGSPDGLDGPLEDAGFNEPQRMEWHDDALYVADKQNHRIRRIDLVSGQVQTVVGTGVPGFSGDGGPALDAQLDMPYGLDIDVDGTMWIADANNHAIRRVDPDGTISTPLGGIQGNGRETGFAEDMRLSLPNHVQVAPDGAIWISDTLNSQVRAYIPE